MQQILSVWSVLSLQKRLVAGLSSLAVFAAVLLLARMAVTPSMALLYSGLDPASSGEVVAALEQRSVAYSIRGAAIYVDSAKRDEMRMTLASEGMPASGAAGYELLDSLSGFGTTAQMFDAAYWRAKEGELARTILAWPQVKSARVHISNQAPRPFGAKEPPVSSVTLNMSSGVLSAGRVRALRYLVASAVAGMSPENVSVIDSERGLISPTGPPGSANPDSDRRAVELRKNVERLLSARVGAGNAMVEVSVETVLERETIVEKTFDPTSRVAISTDTQEVSGTASDSGTAPVTVASNLPDGPGAPGGGGSKSNNSQTRERVNYEVSESTRELVRQPGAIRRLSVAVLVNGIKTVASDGTITWEPRSEAELASLRELVESTVGFSKDRGDIITVKSFEFEPLPEQGSLVSSSSFGGLAAHLVSIVQSVVLALVVLGLGIFVLRPVLTTRALTALPGPDMSASAVTDDPFGGDGFQFAIAGPDGSDGVSDSPVEQLRQIISERQDETVEVLRNWIEASNEEA